MHTHTYPPSGFPLPVFVPSLSLLTHTLAHTHTKEQRLPHSIIIGLILSEACTGMLCRKKKKEKKKPTSGREQRLVSINKALHYV